MPLGRQDYIPGDESLKNDYTHIEQVRNVLEVLRLVEQVKLTNREKSAVQITALAYLHELIPQSVTDEERAK